MRMIIITDDNNDNDSNIKSVTILRHTMIFISEYVPFSTVSSCKHGLNLHNFDSHLK